MRKITKNTVYYYYRKLIKEQGTPNYIAGGWALGLFVGLAVPFGLQLLISIPLSFLLKCSRIGAVAGTFVTNQVTIFFIYPFQCWLGSYLLANPLSYSGIKNDIGQLCRNGDYAELGKLGWDLIMAFLAGGLLLALIAAPIGYFVVRFMVTSYRGKMALHKQKKLEKAREKQ